MERYEYDNDGRLVRISNTADSTLVSYDYLVSSAPVVHSRISTRTYRTSSEYADDVRFYNGLGYLEESLSFAGGGGGWSTYTPYTYDALLRPDREWLPVPAECDDGEYSSHSEDWVLTWYQDNYGDEPECDEERVLVRPYSEISMEFCPSGRVLGRNLPGIGYEQHPTSYEYLADNVDCRAVTGVRTTDGDGRVSVEWRDKEDRLVAADRFDGDSLARTLYRYDWRGDLVQVLTPEGNEYSYTYDSRSRVISKTVPGRGAETFTYDDLDRVISSRDAEQREHGVTICYEYDGIDRLTRKSAKRGGADRTMAEYSYDPSSGLKTGERVYALTADGWVDDTQYLERTFTYDIEERVTGVEEMESSGEYTLTTTFTYDLAGNVLSMCEDCTRCPGGGESVTVLTERTYDNRSRLVGETVSVDGVQKSVITQQYNELGRPEYKYYGVGDDRITESQWYTIQGWPRYRSSSLLGQWYSYEDSENPSWTGNITGIDWEHNAVAGETDSNGSPAAYRPIYSLFSYDSMNRLKDSTVDAGMGIDDRRWSEKDIRYDLDGNILHIDRYQDDPDSTSHSLDFSYSGPHRVGYVYDANGNVNFDPLRGFDMKYNLLNLPSEVRAHQYLEFEPGMNQDIADICDSTAFVTHPPYEGGIGDGEKDRHVPLPGEDGASASASEVQLDTIAGTLILRAEGELLSRSVYYADGTRAVVYSEADSSRVRYIGSMVYVSTPDGEETLSGIVTADGYIDCSGGTENSEMQYFLRDHLGSVRVVAKDRNTVISRRDYLPSGVQMTGNGLTTDYSNGSSWYGFSGKENERDGSRYLHFGARTYDPVGCIFLQTDPLAEKFYDITPYSYCGCNPVNYIDPQGDSLRIADNEALIALINGLDSNRNWELKFNNGVLDPSSIPNNTLGDFVGDLSFIASSEQMVELRIGTTYEYKTCDGSIETCYFTTAPYDEDDSDLLNDPSFVDVGVPMGKHINGNLGRTLVPAPSESMSTNNNVQVIINGLGHLNHRTVGIAHEFGHVVLYLKGMPHKHGEPGVDSYIYKKSGMMSKRLGYDY